MCGIVGILQLDGSVPDQDILRQMMGAMEHRGPDDSGVFADGPLALGFRRLSIIDIQCGHQPLTSSDQRNTIVFNGEIYNHRDIRDVLEKDYNRHFTTSSDTEVLVNALAQWGDAALPRLNGMFAFARWDAVAQRLLLARDRLGKKPLHFVHTRNAFVFASEIKSLLRHPDVTPRVDRSRIASFVTYRYLPGTETLFHGVEVLEPACSMVISPATGIGLPVRWWDFSFPEDAPAAAPKAADPGTLTGQLLELLQDSVRVRLIADVPLGAFLSGGLDSSVIVALMSKLHPESVKTLSVGFSTGFSETTHARKVAEAFHTDHNELIVGSSELIDAMPQALYARESPVSEPSDIPIFLLSALARKTVKAVLSGEGSDEIFAGYPKYVFQQQTAKTLQLLPRGAIRQVAAGMPANLRNFQLALQCMGQHNRFEKYSCWFGAFDEQAREGLLSPELSQSHIHAFSERVLLGRTFRSSVDEMLYLDTRHWLPANLLLRGDRMTMANSLELRCPFLDYRLVEFAACQVPLRLKIRGLGGKWILKQLASQLLPPEIVHRRKWGFKVPVGEWFRGPLAGLLRETLLSEKARARDYFQIPGIERLIEEHRTGRRNWEKQLWILFQLELWHLMFIDRIISPDEKLIPLS